MFKKLIITILIINITAGNSLALESLRTNTLSPKINITHKDFKNQIQFSQRKSGFLQAQEELPQWLNMEALENIKGLKISRTIKKNQVSYIDSDEGPEYLDAIIFKFSYQDDSGKVFKTGEINIHKYHRPEGVRLFLHKANRFNVHIGRFKPDLPRGKAIKSGDNYTEKAGIGISILWLLLAQEQSLQGQRALIFNSELPSQRVFQNLNKRWDSLIFTGTPFYAKDLKLAPLVHVGFDTPNLSTAQMNIVKDFFENKISFVDEDEQSIVFPQLSADSNRLLKQTLIGNSI